MSITEPDRQTLRYPSSPQAGQWPSSGDRCLDVRTAFQGRRRAQGDVRSSPQDLKKYRGFDPAPTPEQQRPATEQRFSLVGP
jgi:hypothetical protein